MSKDHESLSERSKLLRRAGFRLNRDRLFDPAQPPESLDPTPRLNTRMRPARSPSDWATTCEAQLGPSYCSPDAEPNWWRDRIEAKVAEVQAWYQGLLQSKEPVVPSAAIVVVCLLATALVIKVIQPSGSLITLAPPEAPTDGKLLDRIAFAESSGNADARAATSSASGLFQFTDDTWRRLVTRYGKETGISIEMKNDPRAQRIMAGLLTQEHARALRSALGRKPTDGELYVAHFAGLPNAKLLLQARGSAKTVDDLLPYEVLQANRGIFYTAGKARSVDDVLHTLESKVRNTAI